MTNTKRNDALNAKPYWANEHVQFPRLLAEVFALLEPGDFNGGHDYTMSFSLAQLEEATGLDAEQIRELFTRADKRWEHIKSRECPGEPCECEGCGCLVPGVLFPCAAGDSDLACVERCDMCNRYAFDDEAGWAIEKLLMAKGYTLANYLLPGFQWEDAGAVHMVLMKVSAVTGAEVLVPQTVEQAEALKRELMGQPKPKCCPKCGGTSLVVQLPAVFAWNGKDFAVDADDLRSCEFPIEEEAVVVCNGVNHDEPCDFTCKVSELKDKE